MTRPAEATGTLFLLRVVPVPVVQRSPGFPYFSWPPLDDVCRHRLVRRTVRLCHRRSHQLTAGWRCCDQVPCHWTEFGNCRVCWSKVPRAPPLTSASIAKRDMNATVVVEKLAARVRVEGSSEDRARLSGKAKEYVRRVGVRMSHGLGEVRLRHPSSPGHAVTYHIGPRGS